MAGVHLGHHSVGPKGSHPVSIANLAVARPGESPLHLYRRLARAAGGQTLEAMLWLDLKQCWLEDGWPEPHPQLHFMPNRKFAFDFAYLLPHKLAIEVDGGTWTGGRHVTGGGYQRDCEKLNEATIAGWKVLRFTGADVRSGAALDYIRRALHLPSLGVSA